MPCGDDPSDHDFRIAVFSSALMARFSAVHQAGDMDGDRGAESGEVIAALQHRDDPPAAASARDAEDLARHPVEIRFGEAKAAKRIGALEAA